MASPQLAPEDMAADYHCLEILPTDLSAVALARALVAEAGHDLPLPTVHDATLLTSEVVTNALLHGEPPIVLSVHRLQLRLRVLVADQGRDIPQPASGHAPVDRSSGRGLTIVSAVATNWGVHPHRMDQGKTVWFDIEPDLSE